MSPDSPRPSATRRAWRAISALGCILAGASILLCVVLFNKIQESRVDSIRSQCVEQNERHDATIIRLDAEIAKLRWTDPDRAKRAAAGRDGTVRLIDALAPRRDCEKRVQRLVK